MKNEIEKVSCGNYSKTYHIEEALIHHLTYRKPKVSNIGPYFQGVDIGAQRMNTGFDSLDLSEGIEVEDIMLCGMHARVYRPANVEESLPCICYIHGGGFYAGSLAMVENPCKRLAQLSESCVISFAYDLSPEVAYPHAFHQCYDAMQELYEHAETYGVDRHHMAVCADSAGANIALACVQKDAQEQSFITYVMLYYPVVDVRDSYDEAWNKEAYGNVDNEYVEYCVTSLKGSIKGFQSCYLQGNTSPDNPLVSPVCMEDMSILPPMIILCAEYDYLRLQEEMFYEKASKQGQVKMVEYVGINHGFVEKLGVFPQADHSLQRIAKEWRKQILRTRILGREGMNRCVYGK